MLKDSLLLERDSVNHSLSLAKALGQLLLSRGWWVSTAESCTAGGVAYAITSVPGSSQWFAHGWVTYSNLAKQQLLGVAASALAQEGAVSATVAAQMAEGALANSGANLAIAVTGIAGPDGGTPDKPVGTVWFGFATSDGPTQTKCCLFAGDRSQIREQATLYALTAALDLLKLG